MHPDFAALANSWDLTLESDGYSANTRAAYAQAQRSLAQWAGENYPGVAPGDLARDHIRGWLIHLRATCSPNTARGWFAGVRHFCRWMVEEGEAAEDATLGIRTPKQGE